MIFLVAAGLVLMLVWMSDIISALAQAQPPVALLSNTTVVTYVIDLSITIPVTLLSAIFYFRRAPVGYL